MIEEKTEHRKLAAIMFTDIVGYSAMMQKNDYLAIELLEEHRQLLRSIFLNHRGTEKDTAGDAFLVEFDSALNATSCAIEIQEKIHTRNLSVSQEKRIQLRIGIHLGDVVFREDKVFGDGVNIAARIEPLAKPGGICISREVYDIVKHKLDVEVISLGQMDLKNIKDKIDIYEILVGAIAGKNLQTSLPQTVKKEKTVYQKPVTWITAVIILFTIILSLYLNHIGIFNRTKTNDIQQTNVKSNNEVVSDSVQTSVSLQSGQSATADNVTYTVLTGKFDNYSTSEKLLVMKIKVSCKENPINFWDDLFRLVADGVEYPPQPTLSNKYIFENSEWKEDIKFIIPKEVSKIKLHVGKAGSNRTAIIPINNELLQK